jgi:hypothetical protein
MTKKNPNWVSSFRKQQDALMELAQSRGGLAANLAHQPKEVIEHIRDWCNYLLEAKP